MKIDCEQYICEIIYINDDEIKISVTDKSNYETYVAYINTSLLSHHTFVKNVMTWVGTFVEANNGYGEVSEVLITRTCHDTFIGRSKAVYIKLQLFDDEVITRLHIIS